MSLNVKGPPAPPPLLKNAALAPVVYFDSAPAYGVYGGNVEIELAARLLMPKSDNTVATDMTCVAHLRCCLGAAKLLRDALDRAIAMAEQADKSPLLNS